MNRTQREEASIMAAQAIDAGVDPEKLVHIVYHSDNHPEVDEGIQCLSNPISHKQMIESGLSCEHFQLSELAKQIA